MSDELRDVKIAIEVIRDRINKLKQLNRDKDAAEGPLILGDLGGLYFALGALETIEGWAESRNDAIDAGDVRC